MIELSKLTVGKRMGVGVNMTLIAALGLAAPAAEVAAAAKEAGPLPFESPGEYRRRMRAVSGWLKARGMMPSE